MRKIGLLVIFGFSLILTPIIYQSLPIVRSNESYRSIFPKKRFLKKLASPTPKWMTEQLEADFAPFEKITSEMVEASFKHIPENTFYHYRILNNCLYKQVDARGKISSKDNELEKAIKTLLIYARVPDVDFILCPMDGLPEKYMLEDFYLVADSKMQAPIFAKAKLKSAPYIVLIPDQFSLSENWIEVSQEITLLNEEIEWEEKKEEALWRGGLTDIGMPNGTIPENYQDCPRYKISKLTADLVDAKLPWAGTVDFDQIIRDEGVWGHARTKRQHLACKYLPVLDGHMCTYPGYQWRLLSKSLCLKQESDQVQWFYSALKPFVHYIPIQNDMSDLVQQIEWAKENDAKAKEITKNARDFAENHLMPEDDYLYLYLAFVKYAEKQRIDFSTLDMKKFKCIQYRKQNRLMKHLRRKIRACFGSCNGKCAGNIDRVLCPE